MSNILILYYSKSGNTAKMAEYIAEGVKVEKEIDVELKRVEDVNVDDLLNFDGIIIGSPTYYGTMAAEVKSLIDESVKFHGRLEGKVGGAFTSSGGIAGGNETTILDILKAFLVHGMIVQGSSSGDHYGPVAVKEPYERSKKMCIEYGKRIARLVLRLK
jgi:NAD(P)H dehydrogenase (quinone)